MILLLFFLLLLYFIATKESFENKIPCLKWEGDINTSPSNICKDCGYPIDCHGPYKGDSWRHIFRETPL